MSAGALAVGDPVEALETLGATGIAPGDKGTVTSLGPWSDTTDEVVAFIEWERSPGHTFWARADEVRLLRQRRKAP